MASVNYIHMGQWPCFVGFTTSKDDFQKELKRLDVKEEVPFLGSEQANATTWTFNSKGKVVHIICMEPFSRRVSREVYAALVAHECVHVLQLIQEDYAGKRSLGCEADAYLVQYLVQEILSIAWDTGREKSTKPSK